MCMLERRLQILLDEARYQRVAAVAKARGVSVASVIREAIDRGVPSEDARRTAAARTLLDAPDMPVPGLDELRGELDQLRSRRG